MDQVSEYLNLKLKEPQCVIISTKVLKICEEFAEKVNQTTVYSDCGQTNQKKKLFDNLVGKLAEFAVFNLLNSVKKDKFTVNEPDVNIYEGNKKSWDSDLCITKGDGKINVAVKCQDISQAKIYGFSGTFQNSSSRKDKAIDKKDELVFLCLHFVQNKIHKIMIMPPKTVGDIYFLAPKEARLADSKTCYYVYNNFDVEHLKKWLKKFDVDEKVIYGNSNQQNVYLKLDKEIVSKLNGVDLNGKVREMVGELVG